MDKSASAADAIKKRIFLYKSNDKMCVVYVLGQELQEINHGLAKLKDTKLPEYMTGKIWNIIAALTNSNRPKNHDGSGNQEHRVL
jgi:hypothetical protein